MEREREIRQLVLSLGADALRICGGGPVFTTRRRASTRVIFTRIAVRRWYS